MKIAETFFTALVISLKSIFQKIRTITLQQTMPDLSSRFDGGNLKDQRISALRWAAQDAPRLVVK